jgi:hypothetical protein
MWTESDAGLVNLDLISSISPNELSKGHYTIDAFTGTHRIRLIETEDKDEMMRVYEKYRNLLLPKEFSEFYNLCPEEST